MFRYCSTNSRSQMHVCTARHTVIGARVHTAQYGQLYGFTAMAGRSPPPSDVSVGRYATVGLIL
jgi:hypothetical protein